MQAKYPKATWLGNGQSGGSYIGGKPDRIVLHTTETASLPGYNNGSAAPHMTYDPKTRRFYQHTPFTTACRALRNTAGGVQTNRWNSYQLEIICYSAKSVADQSASRLWVGNLPEHAYQDIAEWIRWMSAQSKVKLTLRLPRPAPLYGVNSPSRMSASQWGAFSGLCGHFEVPENTHWDTGALDIVRLVKLASGVSPEPPPLPPTTKENETMFPIRRNDGTSSQRPEKSEDIKHLQHALKLMSIDTDTDGVADQDFLDAFFGVVGSPRGGSYISGEEGAIFEKIRIEWHTASAPAPTPPPPAPLRTHKVVSGDTLKKIAKTYLGAEGRWPEIYELNRALIGSNANNIRIGMILNIPDK